MSPATAELREKLGVQAPAESISWLNMMIYSEPGVGKTYFCGTAMDHKDTAPLLMIDIDGGVSTLRKRRDVDVIQVRSVNQLIGAHRDLYNAIPADPKKGKFPYGTVAIDTFSELQSVDLAQIMKVFARMNDKIDPDVPDQRGYGKSLSHMRDIVRMFRDLPCNTILTCHAQSDRDNNMRMIHFPKLTGQMKVVAPGFVDIVGYYRAEADKDGVTRYMQFQKTESAIAKDRTGAFAPVEIDPTVPSLWAKLQESNEGES
jgi:phage nucleotide-binding protein